ncbi:DEAD/DEAH box helicase family protein [Bacillus cereus]|uniref:Uncharacterized protein n=1 Tax=Bacillus cereus TaxID=1396 RepID=A0A2A7HUG1_BACCE|nr:DEAD/DEAH box helicase family protein [Bacillus cereus]PEC20587.1 hypothetical protein COM96_18565 [Bacillus cereus]
MSKVTVIDSIMGSGKTSWAKQKMLKEKNDKRFIYVTPYLNEIENNILVDCPFLVQPNETKGKGSKLKHFKELLVNGENIITTHALFSMFDNEVMELLENAGYTLILDEVANVLERVDKVTSNDIKILLEANVIEIENRKVIWLDNMYNGVFSSKYANIKYQAQQGNMYVCRDSIMFWTFPTKVFDLFDETYILTYLFDGQVQRYYYDFFEIKYIYKSIKKMGKEYVLVSNAGDSKERYTYRKFINVYEGLLNENYMEKKPKGNELSSTWLSHADMATIKRLKQNLYTYFRKNCNAKSADIIWTTKKDYKTKLKGKGYTKGFISLNTRATNDYQEAHNLAYVYNRYMNPMEKAFFEDAGVKVNEDLLAVSDLLQWIWRSAIRKHNPEPINIYIPSLRMRTLLYQWLSNEVIKFKK